ncbi:MAG TPA: DUF4282 domain-containing protein [Devosiaceae bacterium]|nr:DUF4282 domain-containing protein [Devosiaceae bacterium]
MTPDDLRKLSTSPTLFNLDRLISPRIIKVLYLLGLAGIALWVISHLVTAFVLGFWAGLWGLLEIAVFGLLAFIVLRIACEALIVYFRQNEKLMAGVAMPKAPANIFEDVKDALEELADGEAEAAAKPRAVTARTSAASASSAKSPARKRAAPSRTRKPAGKPSS